MKVICLFLFLVAAVSAKIVIKNHVQTLTCTGTVDKKWFYNLQVFNLKLNITRNFTFNLKWNYDLKERQLKIDIVSQPVQVVGSSRLAAGLINLRLESEPNSINSTTIDPAITTTIIGSVTPAQINKIEEGHYQLIEYVDPDTIKCSRIGLMINSTQTWLICPGQCDAKYFLVEKVGRFIQKNMDEMYGNFDFLGSTQPKRPIAPPTLDELKQFFSTKIKYLRTKPLDKVEWLKVKLFQTTIYDKIVPKFDEQSVLSLINMDNKLASSILNIFSNVQPSADATAWLRVVLMPSSDVQNVYLAGNLNPSQITVLPQAANMAIKYRRESSEAKKSVIRSVENSTNATTTTTPSTTTIKKLE